MYVLLRFAVGVLFCLLFLREMALTVCNHFSCIITILTVISFGLFIEDLIKDLDNSAAAAHSAAYR